MRTVDLIQRKRNGEELAPEEIEFLVEGYTNGDIPDYQMSSFLMAVFFSGMSDREVSRLTEGTLDKLESIPGFRTNLSTEEFQKQLGELGLCFIGQTDHLAPADRKLYALRDVTGTVESIPLISSSIMSKKLAEGVDALVLDVKTGSGAFIPEPERALEFARTMI